MKRLIAKKCLIEQLNKGMYIKTAGWNPSYILIGKEQVSIVNIMGIVIEVQNKLVVVDDGTGNIQVRFFDNNIIPELKIGEAVQIIGRIGEHDNTKFVTGQAVSKIVINWLKVRREEVKRIKIEEKPKEIKTEIKEVTQSFNIKDNIIEKIKKTDSGKGVEVNSISKGDRETEKAILSLLEEGEIFEITPGRIKVLE